MFTGVVMSRVKDLLLAITITYIAPAAYYQVGQNYLHGSYYPHYDLFYFAIYPVITMAIVLFLRPPALFLSGVALAFLITYLLLFSRETLWPSDLIGVDLMFATPGAIVGAMLAAKRLQKRVVTSPSLALAFSLIGTISGFMLVDLLFCNSLFYCGPFSLMFYFR